MIESLKAYWRSALMAVLIAAGFAGGWYIQGNRWNADVATKVAQYTNNMKTVSDANAKQLADEQAKGQALQAALATLDTKYNLELANEQSANNILRNQLNTGALKLRVKAKCPASASSSSEVPNDSTAGGVGNDATVELSATVGSDILNIRAGILSDQAALKYLQDYALSLESEGIPK